MTHYSDSWVEYTGMWWQKVQEQPPEEAALSTYMIKWGTTWEIIDSLSEINIHVHVIYSLGCDPWEKCSTH